MVRSSSAWVQGLLLAPVPLGTIAQSSTMTGTMTMTSFAPQFTVPTDADVGQPVIPNIMDPQAVDAQTVCPGYTASNLVNKTNGFTASLTLAGDACNVYGTDINDLTLTVEYQTDQRLHVSVVPSYISSSNSSHYILSPSLVPAGNGSSDPASNDLQFAWSNDPSFSFSVTRKSTGDKIFDTTGSNLVFENQFVEFVTAEPPDYNLYGLGESIHGLRLGNNFTKTMYAADVGDPIDYNIYGSHPFYLDTRYMNTSTGSSSYSHGVYQRNAHGQEILLRAQNVTWRTIGGSIDLYFFSGPDQPSVTRQYQEIIGLPVMQQYFTFGFHQCRWGYHNWSQVEEVVNNYESFGIPLENIWTDIDYMFQYRDFQNDPIRYPYDEGQEFLQRLHDSGRHYVPIIDSAIYHPDPNNASDAYPVFNDGEDTGSYLLNPNSTEDYIGSVWPGYTVFPDWLTQAANDWWTKEMVSWHNKISFDGAWIDMSEVSSFCVGSCGTGNVSLNPVHPPFGLPGEPGYVIYDYPEGFNLTNTTEANAAASASASQASAYSTSSASASTSYLRTTPTPGVRNINYPPYTINNVQGDLAVHAVSPNATHHDGTLEYDVHNLFGHQILQATYDALSSVFPGKRPFIIGRSTFSGSGHYAGHWGGDNASKWYYMFFSIPQALSFSLFGVPMFGVDTCGFNGNSDEELCNRWMQLSAFFPFYRNHNTLSANSQEAYVWASVAEATKTAMNVRFQLLPYMYTLFHLAHTTGSTVMRALAWEFPNDPTLAAADRQFMLGPAILVTPVLVQGATSVQGVFPGLIEGTDSYFDWYTQSPVPVPSMANTTIDAPLGHIPVYLRGGNVLALQQPAMVTRDARQTPWSVVVALGVNGTAAGTLYLDDGESITPNATKSVTFSATSSSLTAGVSGTYADSNPLSNVTVLGVKSAPTGVKLNGMSVQGGQYDAQDQRFFIGGLDNATQSVGGAWAGNWTLTW
ncbi:MAG: hypothetical protein Q9227_000555 [Pyrenula ochraceoflavens]